MQLGNVDVTPLAAALQAQPELWNRHRFRTTYEGTPHREVDDILLRFSPADMTEVEHVINDVAPVFYPAWNELPQARPIVFDLMRRVEAYSLGRVIISRLKPGGTIVAHRDADGAYTAQPRGMRFHVAVQGLPGSLYHCGGETVQMLSGSVWWFDHTSIHCVENNSADDRIHLMVDVEKAP